MIKLSKHDLIAIILCYFFRKIRGCMKAKYHIASRQGMVDYLRFYVPLKEFHLYGDVANTSEGLQNCCLCLAPLSKERSLSCHTWVPLDWDASHYGMIIPSARLTQKGRLRSPSQPSASETEDSAFHYGVK
jgi:hypothetical protein